mmetsp:Transcript_3843/g.8637  ORF Transcript_3843/g.8637 Transcript_3843/m.8637 type:complete len:203 (-) Transcript_3843:733-1341(-)
MSRRRVRRRQQHWMMARPAPRPARKPNRKPHRQTEKVARKRKILAKNRNRRRRAMPPPPMPGTGDTSCPTNSRSSRERCVNSSARSRRSTPRARSTPTTTTSTRPTSSNPPTPSFKWEDRTWPSPTLPSKCTPSCWRPRCTTSSIPGTITTTKSIKCPSSASGTMTIPYWRICTPVERRTCCTAWKRIAPGTIGAPRASWDP